MTQQFMRNISGRLIATTEQRIRATLRVFLDRGMVEPQRTVAIFLARGAESDKLDQIEAILKREGWQDVPKKELPNLSEIIKRIDSHRIQVRIRAALEGANIKDTETLCSRGHSDMIKMKGIGRRSYKLLAKALEEEGIKPQSWH